MRAKTLLMLISSLLYCACSGGGTSGTGGFSYRGTVSNETGGPSDGAVVSLESAAGSNLASTATSNDGQFDFSKIAIADAVIIVRLTNGTTAQLMISIPKGKNVARITFEEKNGSLKNKVQFENRSGQTRRYFS